MDEETDGAPLTRRRSSAVADLASTAREDTPLLGTTTVQEEGAERQDDHGQHSPPTLREVFAILSVLLLGVFIANTDSTLVFATLGDIASEFDDLQSSAWLFSSFGLASCVAQPLYGKLSDIFGRKAMLQISYFLFAVGGAVCGLGNNLTLVIIGRAIQGAGCSGMTSLVSILITDLVPLREVATYRSYVNIVQTVARSAGGPIGGALAQTIGWRWAFTGQAPLTIVAMIIVAWRLQVKPKQKPGPAKADAKSSTLSKLKRIDILGALLMSTTILAALLILDIGGDKVAWNSPIIYILAGVALLAAVLFYFVEEYWASEPIFPIRLITHKEVLLDYGIILIQTCAQVALMYFIPLYFQVTKDVGAAEAGAYMVPAVVGNTLGGLGTGYYVQRTGRYKLPLIIGGLSTILCFSVLLALWHGNTPAWQALFVFFGGFAAGIANSATFVDVAATVEPAEMAIASSGLYLSGNVGMIAGVSGAGAVFTNVLKARLMKLLEHYPQGGKIAKEAASNIDYVRRQTGQLHDLLVEAFVFAFRHCYVFSLVCGAVILVCALLVREKKLAYD